MSKKSSCCDSKIKERLGKVGGQAVLEGVMMKAGTRAVTTCRKEDGSIFINDGTFISVRDKYKILNMPIIRGVINFVEMMILSFRTLGASADALELDDEKDKQKKAEGKKTTTDFVMILGLILGVALAVALKEAMKLLNVFDIIQISLLIDAVRYFTVVMAVGYLCPLLFKKINL